jgi:AcrR family transcriptional regulator
MMYIQIRHWYDMKRRRYQSSIRDAAASRTRERLVDAAVAVLGTVEGIGEFSLAMVAKKAGVTRLTVYNQFGSRRALLEAAFDEIAVRGGLLRLNTVMADADPHAALSQTIAIFCEFWSSGLSALRLLHASGASDPELAQSVDERNERRRGLLRALVRGVAKNHRMPPKTQRDLVDTLFALTSFWFFSQLTIEGRTAEAVCRIIQQLAADAMHHHISTATANQTPSSTR